MNRFQTLVHDAIHLVFKKNHHSRFNETIFGNDWIEQHQSVRDRSFTPSPEQIEHLLRNNKFRVVFDLVKRSDIHWSKERIDGFISDFVSPAENTPPHKAAIIGGLFKRDDVTFDDEQLSNIIKGYRRARVSKEDVSFEHDLFRVLHSYSKWKGKFIDEIIDLMEAEKEYPYPHATKFQVGHLSETLLLLSNEQIGEQDMLTKVGRAIRAGTPDRSSFNAEEDCEKHRQALARLAARESIYMKTKIGVDEKQTHRKSL